MDSNDSINDCNGTEDRDQRIVEMLMEGRTQGEVRRDVCCRPQRVRVLYYERVKPSLRNIDISTKLNGCVVKEMTLARWQHALSVQAPDGKNWADHAAATFGCTRAKLERALTVLKRGCDQLIKKAERGEIALSTAGKLARLSHEDQLADLRSMKHERRAAPLDEFRSRLSTLLDQKYGWEQSQGGLKAVRGLSAEAAESGELSEFIQGFENVIQWATTVLGILREAPRCSPQTHEPKTT